MRLIHQLIDYFRQRGLLLPEQLQKLEANFFARGSQAEDDYGYEPDYSDRRPWETQYYEQLEAEKQDDDHNALELEAKLDARRPVRSRIRKKAAGKSGKAARSEDYRPGVETIARRLDAGIRQVEKDLESLLDLAPSANTNSWQEAAAAIAGCAEAGVEAQLAKVLGERKVEPGLLLRILTIDLATMAGTDQEVVSRAFRAILANPESARPGRTKWGHRLLALPVVCRTMTLAKAQKRLAQAWCRLCTEQPCLVFGALRSSPDELGLWITALLSTARKLFPLDTSAKSASPASAMAFELVKHSCDADLWTEAWAWALQTEAARVFTLLLHIDKELPYHRRQDIPGQRESTLYVFDWNHRPRKNAVSDLPISLYGPIGWNAAMHEAIKRKRKSGGQA